MGRRITIVQKLNNQFGINQKLSKIWMVYSFRIFFNFQHLNEFLCLESIEKSQKQQIYGQKNKRKFEEMSITYKKMKKEQSMR